MLERAGEQRLDATVARRALSSAARSGPKPTTTRRASSPRQRLDQDVHALLLDQLAEVDDDGRRRLRGSARAARRCPRRAGAPRRCRGSAGRGGLPRAAPARATSRGSGTHSSMSTPGGTSITFSVWPHTSASTVRMCSEPTNVARAAARASAPQAESSGLPRIEYSSSEPCALTANGAPVAAPTGPPRRTWFVKTTSAGRSARIADGVRLDPGVELGAAAVLHAPHVVALVAVEDEDRQQPADVGAQRTSRCRGRSAPGGAPGRGR